MRQHKPDPEYDRWLQRRLDQERRKQQREAPPTDWPWVPLHELHTLDVPEKRQIMGPLETSQQVVIAAERGVGKTWHAVEWANAIAWEDDFGSWKSELHRKSLFCQFDMPVHSAIKRQRLSVEAGARYHPEFMYLTRWQLKQAGLTVPRLSDKNHHQQIVDVILAGGFQMVWFDTLRKAQPPGEGQAGNSWHPAYWEASEPVRSALVDEGLTLVFLHHANADGSSKDTGAIEDDVDLVLLYRDVGVGIGDGVSFRMEFAKYRDGIPTDPINWQMRDGKWAAWTEETVHHKMFEDHLNGDSNTVLAERYNMHRNTVSNILKKERLRIRQTHGA